MLTETGISRWLAAHSVEECVDLRAPLQELLPRERKRQTVRWAEMRTPIAEVAFWFRENTFLEAVLLVEQSRGNATAKELRGIVTRGDVASI
jgi:hypothetical protein